MQKCPELFTTTRDCPENPGVSVTTNDYEPKYTNFPFELDHFQKYACQGIDEGDNILLTAHTGAGKTVPAEYLISKAFALEKKVVYISPIKALSNQKYHDWKEKYPDIGLLTGDNKVSPNAQLVIMTAEIFRNALHQSMSIETGCTYDYKFDPMLVKYVIFDEIHYLNDPDRGKVWEEILLNLPKDTQIVMLSATIGNSEKVASWIGELYGKTIRLITTAFRPVPLSFNYYHLSNPDPQKRKILKQEPEYIESLLSSKEKPWSYDLIKQVRESEGKFSDIHWINGIAQYLKMKDRLPAIFFVLSKKNLEFFASKLTGDFNDHIERAQTEFIWNKHLLRFRDRIEHTSQYQMVKELALRGIGIHHSGLQPVLKEIVEILFGNKLIKVLFATETFAVGINMPTRTVIFTQLVKHDGKDFRILRPDEFRQMAGRAGRRGLDKIGYVYFLPLKMDYSESDLQNLLLGKAFDIKSKFKLDPELVLRATASYRSGDQMDYLLSIIKASLFENQFKDEINGDKVELENFKRRLTPYDNLDKTKYLEYLELSNSLKTIKSQNAYKRALTQVKNMKDNFDQNTLKRLEQWYGIFKGMEELEEKIVQADNTLKIQILKILDFLDMNGYIATSTVDNIVKVTEKGIVAIECSDLHPMICAEMVTQGVFNNITYSELVSIISLFIPENYVKGISLADISGLISDNLITKVKQIEILTTNYTNKELQLLQQLPYQYNAIEPITLNMIPFAYMWASDYTWKEIVETCNTDIISEGNMVKNILRIMQILRQIQNVAKITNNIELYNLIATNDGSLFRELVMVESLYL